MKKIFSVLAVIALFGIVLAFDGPEAEAQKDWSTCMEKYDTKWGGQCEQYGQSEDKYTVFLRNTCDESVDVMVCMQQANLKWRCFNKSSLAPDGEMEAYACKSNKGKKLMWVRKAGDEATTFPTKEEVNELYKN